MSSCAILLGYYVFIRHVFLPTNVIKVKDTSHKHVVERSSQNCILFDYYSITYESTIGNRVTSRGVSIPNVEIVKET